MRILFIHADYLEYEIREKALKTADEVPAQKRKGRMEEGLVCFVSAEERDEKDVSAVVRTGVREIEDVASRVKTRRVVLYPYAHLSSSLARGERAKEILAGMEQGLLARGYEVLASPFGWYKSFKISCKGHPLSELSREFGVEGSKEVTSKALRAEERLVSHWFVLDMEGDLHPLSIQEGKVVGYDFSKHVRLGKFAAYEMAKSRTVKEEPPHIRHMQGLELADYEPGSDPGNLRYYPKGRLVKSLLEEYVTQRVIEYGGMEIESPIMYDFEHPSLKSYLDRFPARQYVVETPNKRAFLRFAACFGQFLMAHDMILSYKQLPVKLYELTRYSFRAEQRGELAGLRRLRAFTMPDCHCFVSDMDMAKQEMLVRWDLSWSTLTEMGLKLPEDLEVGLRVTKNFFEEHRDFIGGLAHRWGKPIFLEMWSEQFFYFVLKYEWNFVDSLDKAAALNTDQIDTENAKRYGITYVDATGQRKHPLILHLSPCGAIERVLYALLEKADQDMRDGKPPMLPVWLSPVQLRLIPLSDDQVDHCVKLAEHLRGVRVDIDDTSESLSKKIRNAEREWIPYIAVVGKKEVETGKLSVRVRRGREQRSMTVREVEQLLLSDTKGRPFRPLPLPRLLSLRPSFRG